MVLKRLLNTWKSMSLAVKVLFIFSFFVLIIYFFWPYTFFSFSIYEIPLALLFLSTYLIHKFQKSSLIKVFALVLYLAALIIIAFSKFAGLFCGIPFIRDEYSIKISETGKSYFHEYNDRHYFITDPKNHQDITKKLQDRGWKITQGRGIYYNSQIVTKGPKKIFYATRTVKDGKEINEYIKVPHVIRFWIGNEIQQNIYSKFHGWIMYVGVVNDIKYVFNIPVKPDSFFEFKLDRFCT